jgi:hypothetical protein
MSATQYLDLENIPTAQAEAIASKFVKMGAHVMVTDHGTKRCRTPEWEQKATNNLDEALQIVKTKPNGNVMLVGKQDGIWALDDDAGLVAEYEETHGPLQTYATRTVSGGRHFIFRQNSASWEMGNVSVSDENRVELLSARVNDRYVIAAGSWAYPDNDTSKPLTQYTAINPAASFIEAPQSLLDFIKAKDAEWKIKRSKAVVEASASNQPIKVMEGGRNDYLTSRGGKLRDAGASYESILFELTRINENECVPPLPIAEVESVAKSVFSYPEGKPPLILNQRPAEAAPVDVSNWQSLFRSIGEMEDGPIDMIIEGALQEGTCFLGATAGDGKTLVALAFAKAISTGTPLFNLPQYNVATPRPVIYLIPESRDRAFRKRCIEFQLPDDKSKFMTRTISAGVPLELSDPRLIEAVRQTKAVVFLDTASRFMKGNDENAAAQNRLLVNDVVTLLAAGAACVVLLHHATKSAKMNQERMTLENMLRGTGDFGAMCDQAYGIRKDMNLYANGSGPMEIDLVSLKDREQIGGLTNLRLAGSYKTKITEKGRIEVQFPQSYVRETGNFRVLSEMEANRRESQSIISMVKQDPNIPAKDIALSLGVTEYRVKSTLEYNHYHRAKGGPGGASPWHIDVDGVCPYDKVVEVKPSKKALDTTVAGVVQDLRELLARTSPVGVNFTETDLLAWADKRGITEPVLNKAKRRLGLVRGKANNRVTWSLPNQSDGSDAF